jgi:hypothetical protein
MTEQSGQPGGSGQPDPPDPPNNWRVYEEDSTPDPEPPSEPPSVPYGAPPSTPHVPYGAAGQTSYNPVFVTTRSSSAAPKIIILVIALVVLGGVAAAAVAIFAAVDGGIGGIGGVNPKDPEDFAQMVEELEEERGSTEVWEVGLYDGYAIVYVPVDSSSTKYDALRWDGGGFEDWTKGTSTYTRFDLAELDPEVLDGMCDPVLDQADGATPSDCYVFIRKPGPPFGGNAWFSAGASDEYGQYFNVEYDKFGVEIPEAQ